jgi:DNA adenine methylase
MDASLFKLGWAIEKVPQPSGYPGGKNKLTRAILAHAPDHDRYVEPFAGGVAVFFAKKPAKINILNDIDPQVTGFLRNFSCKRLSSCTSIPPTTAVRKRVTRKFRQGSTDTCDYVMARYLSFNANGKDIYRGFRMSSVPARISRRCHETEARLAKAKILNEDFRKVVHDNDKPRTWQFWDPPYEGRAKGFYKFEEGVSPEVICQEARKLKHAKVLITHYNNPHVRKACAGLYMKTVPYQYVSRNRNHGKVHRVRELLIANYPI